MNRIKKSRFILLASSLLLFAACSKEQDTPAPDLSVPEMAFPRADKTSPPRTVPAEKEVSAEKGPIKLTLRLYTTKIKSASGSLKRDYLRYQITLTNIGKNKILMTDDVFQGPWNIKLEQEGFATPSGVHLKVTGPDGKIFQRPRMGHIPLDCWPKGARTNFEEYTDGVFEIVQQGDKEGWSDKKLNQKVFEYQDARQKKREKKMGPEPPLNWLAPGASEVTAAWAYQDLCDKKNGVPAPKPIGEFADLHTLWFYEPGKYRIRAVYDREFDLSPDKKREFTERVGFPPPQPQDWNVRIETPGISFEVVP